MHSKRLFFGFILPAALVSALYAGQMLTHSVAVPQPASSSIYIDFGQGTPGNYIDTTTLLSSAYGIPGGYYAGTATSIQNSGNNLLTYFSTVSSLVRFAQTFLRWGRYTYTDSSSVGMLLTTTTTSSSVLESARYTLPATLRFSQMSAFVIFSTDASASVDSNNWTDMMSVFQTGTSAAYTNISLEPVSGIGVQVAEECCGGITSDKVILPTSGAVYLATAINIVHGTPGATNGSCVAVYAVNSLNPLSLGAVINTVGNNAQMCGTDNGGSSSNLETYVVIGRNGGQWQTANGYHVWYYGAGICPADLVTGLAPWPCLP
jgi:hypothetical protein